MRIFPSYASEHHAVAEEVALALRNEGHIVFFDRDDLPPGTIRSAERLPRATCRSF